MAVYLPKEKILAAGDMLVHSVPFAYGSSMAKWIDVLKQIRAMETATIVPGHGP